MGEYTEKVTIRFLWFKGLMRANVVEERTFPDGRWCRYHNFYIDENNPTWKRCECGKII